MVEVVEEMNLDVEVNPTTYDFIKNSNARKTHLYGSAGSGKSWAIGQHLIINKMFGEHDIRIIVVRKTGPSLTRSAWTLVKDLFKKYNLPYEVNNTTKTITCGSNEMIFLALDDPLKLKSIEKINYVWAEEADELYKDDYLQLGLRCRGFNPNNKNQLYFSYNPVFRGFNKYLKDISLNPPDGTIVQHSTYLDNVFLSEDEIREIEDLRESDQTYWTIYGEGRWATPKNIIYSNWDIIPAEKWPEIRNIGYGLDFGYNAPTALIEIGTRENEAWERELLYEKKLTNTELIEKLHQLIPDRRKIIVADCAQPERIEEILQAGFNIWPCSKGPSSIKIGIDRVKRFKIHVHSSSANLVEEKQTYKWKEDYNGDALDAPVDYNNHLLDAERYYIGEIKFDGVPEFIIIGNYLG